ncbi:hypothetical protein MTR67_017075 [Solanum verrucosum]|uniref:DUF4218 domain-containing protein n=1 Tax=Solanum verrucosum TaxID=315347 RepID=A0AAF0QJU8_SOLVR|nr:hypothetical protein MTR67_017075 [Solanum verrucosum]
MCSKTSSLMKWHHENKASDGIMRHPVDSKAWKKFDELHQSFAMEPRNVRLGLSSDGFQPFGCSRTPYSIWPVVLIPYNLPPWLCMKQENFVFSMLILGPGSPGDAIDVYLQPLIDELNELWKTGVVTFDASIKQNFTLHAALLWTINDFPAYANLSGWSTKGKLACPCCNKETISIRLNNGQKQCYMGHRRFLPLNHKWRKDKKSFDGTTEWRLPPNTLSGDDILDQVADLDGLPLTNDPKKKIKVSHEKRGDNWNKKSIFFYLPYWKTLLLRHNLDVMHIEKNICDNILGTILNIKGKTKDTLSSRLDLQEMNIRKELHPKENGDKYELPTACFTLSPEEKHKFLNFLKDLRVPDGFSSNISHCINMKDHKISGLKSHDCHGLLQHLIPLAIRSMLCTEVREPIIELSLFFNILGAKCLKLEELEQIEAQIPETQCKLEKVFLPAFFDDMEHLPIHLANEAMIAGPVQYRSMYPIERWLYFLKLFIRNRSCVEGSIAEGHIANEFTTLCSRYLHTMETKFNRLERNYDGGAIESDGGLMIFCQPGKALKGGKTHRLDLKEMEQAHIYILKNCDEVQPFLEEFSQVPGLYEHDNSKKIKDLLTLSRGPMKYVTSFKGYIINGYRFHVQDYDNGLRTQNCGIVVAGETDEEDRIIDYYGELTEILELQFIGGRRLVLFRCMWYDVYDKERGVKMDEYDFETSTRNTRNRSKLSMPHRTCSKPIREIIYELGGKHGNPPDMATIFFETRKKDNKLLEPETNKKYDEIQELLQVEPSLTNIKVVERCFGPQSKSHVIGFGGGITSRDLKGGSAAKTALLEELNTSRKEKAALLEELNATRKENESIKRCLDNIEKKCEMFDSAIFRDPSSPPSSSE